MVVDIELRAVVFIFNSKVAKLDLVAAAGGLPDLPPDTSVAVGGRCETQSWTNIETLGFCNRFSVFSDLALVVMMITGPSPL